MKTKLFITGLAFIALTMSVNAQGKNAGQAQQQTNTAVPSGAYIDANNNGVCDNFEANSSGRGSRRGAGYGFRGGSCPVTAQATANRQGLPQGHGRGFGPGQGRGIAPGGRYFVDADNNGICDRFEDQSKDDSSKK
jgi:hypothetical protein